MKNFFWRNRCAKVAKGFKTKLAFEQLRERLPFAADTIDPLYDTESPVAEEAYVSEVLSDGYADDPATNATSESSSAVFTIIIEEAWQDQNTLMIAVTGSVQGGGGNGPDASISIEMDGFDIGEYFSVDANGEFDIQFMGNNPNQESFLLVASFDDVSGSIVVDLS